MSPIDDAPLYEKANERMRQVRVQIAEKLADQIVDIALPFLVKPLDQLHVLDCGSGYGQTAIALARKCGHVTAIEPSRTLHEYALASYSATPRTTHNVTFLNAGIEDLQSDNAFDLIVLDNVLEHIADQRRAMKICNGALKDGGLLLIIVPNKLWPIEVHYGLPFLSYLPLPLANRYLRITGRGKDYSDASYAPTYWRLRRILRETGFGRHHFVVPRNLSNSMKGAVWYYRLGAAVLRRFTFLWPLSKAFVVVAIKS